MLRGSTRWGRVVLAVLPVILAVDDVHAHGGIGIPTVQLTRPGRGEILEATAGTSVEIRWLDIDPDDNANLILFHQSDRLDPTTAIMFVSGISEDCDGADGGPLFT